MTQEYVQPLYPIIEGMQVSKYPKYPWYASIQVSKYQSMQVCTNKNQIDKQTNRQTQKQYKQS